MYHHISFVSVLQIESLSFVCVYKYLDEKEGKTKTTQMLFLYFQNTHVRTVDEQRKLENYVHVHLLVLVLYKIRKPHWRHRTGSPPLITFLAPQSPHRYSTPLSNETPDVEAGIPLALDDIFLNFFRSFNILEDKYSFIIYKSLGNSLF